MNYYRYLFSDKKAGPYWIMIFLVVIVITAINIILRDDESVEFHLSNVGENLIIHGQVYDMGIFRRHLRPILLRRRGGEMQEFKYVEIPVIREFEQRDNGFQVRFEKSVSGITKLEIKDFINTKATNNS